MEAPPEIPRRLAQVPSELDTNEDWGMLPEPDKADEEEVVRRLWPARDDRIAVYVQEAGTRIGLEGERLAIVTRAGQRTEAKLSNTSHVMLLGNVQVTTQALRALLERGIPVTFATTGGWVYGRATGHDTKNVELRVAQHAAAADVEGCLRVAKGLIASKIRNSRTLLRRNHAEPSAITLGELEILAKKAEKAESRESLLGIEGAAARLYFRSFSGMLRGPAAALGDFDFESRNRRPPKDPLNALLSLSYSLLTKDMLLAVQAAGLDPLLGFYHQPRFGRPALALDLMEEFRPILADSIVLNVINNGVVKGSSFVRVADAVSLTDAARKDVMKAHERRLDELVTHPVFGYRLSYRRVLEVQARLLGRLLLGEVETYPAFRTR